ncbi:MAG: DNA polymerase I [Deltaproteobacteria bacterium]|nr:DNA polymerase I [Deltaproteobacteria bacterium]
MAEEPRVLYLIDISSYFYRAFHAIRGLSTSKGFPTNAAFGVTNMLLKVLRERQPQYLALVFDSKAPTVRHKRYPEYKAHRPPMPEELVMQLPYIHKIIKALNLPALELEGFEADDLICTLAKKALDQGFQVEIISGDRDLLPCVTAGVDMWDPMKETRYDPQAIREKYGLEPEQLVDVKSLAGDPSDNIPGVPGIGEKTALKLISQYHSLENLLAHVDEIKEKSLKARLKEHADQARLSRELVLLNESVPLPVDPEALHPGAPDREALRQLFVELEFSKFTKELGFDLPAAEACFLARGVEDLEGVARGIRETGEMGIFFITAEQHPVMAAVAGVGLSWHPEEAAYVPLEDITRNGKEVPSPPPQPSPLKGEGVKGSLFGEGGKGSLSGAGVEGILTSEGVKGSLKGEGIIPSSVSGATNQITNLLIINNLLTENRKPKTENGIIKGNLTAGIWEKLGPMWADPGVRKIGPDLKAAAVLGRRFGQDLAGITGDILLASYLLNPARYEQTLENVALHHLGINLPGPKDLTGRPTAAADLPRDLACQYAAARAQASLNLWPRLKAQLEKEGLWDLYRQLELPLLAVLARMEERGILVDQEFLRRFGQDLEVQMARLEQEIYALAGETFLINSPQQLSRILFDKLKITPQKKTKGKTAYSTDMEVLQSLAPEAPIAAKVLEYRGMGKLKATYVDALLKLVNPATDRVHTTFLQSVAATGRLSSRDPNLQNIPVRGELGGQLRQAFIPPPGWVFLSADYSQMELRLLAHFSEDPALLRAFQEKVDIHRQTAAVVFNIHPELVTSEMRRQAKVVNFGIIYGMSPFGLAKQLGVGTRIAHEFIQRYFARHTQVKAYLDRTLEEAQKQGWVTTLLGRRRQIPQINSANRILRQEAERAAINTPLQGTAADIIKKAMIQVEAYLQEANLKGRMLLQLHDELLFEAPREELPETARRVRRVMEGVVELRVPLVVDLRQGHNWGEMYLLDKSI